MKPFINLIKKHPFIFLLFLGFLLRISLLFFDYSFDVNNHIVWAKDLWKQGFLGFYERQSSEVYATVYPNYPPLSLFIFYLLYPLQSLIYKVLWIINISTPFFPSKLIFFIQERTFLAGLFKLPAVFADLILAAACFRISQKLAPKKKKLHLLVAGLILFNPAFFDNSALWGQIDAVPLILAVGSFYLVFYEKRLIFSAVLFVLGLLIKPTILVFLPIYLAVIFKKFPVRKAIEAIIVGNIVFFISFLPFWSGGYNLFSPYILYLKKILETQSLPYVTNGAFNFWVLITYFEGIKDTAPFLLGVSYRIWGYGIVGSLLLIISYYLLSKNKISPERVFFALALIALASFVFLTKMHERYSMLYLPFLLVAAVKDKKLIGWFAALSLLSYLNLYHSWPVPRVEAIIGPLYDRSIVILLSGFNLLLFFILWQRYRQSFSPKDT